jgi:O-antigen/teichoic acid export membrane protein
LTGGGLREVLIAYLLGKSVSSLILSIAALVEAQRRWGSGWLRAPLGLLRPKFGELARFALNTNVAATLSLVTKDSELLLVSWLRSPVETGYYKLALTLTNIVQMPVSSLPQTTYPELSRLAARSDWAGMRSLLKRGALLAGGYAAAATLFLLLFGRPLISLLYTPEFLPAYPALIIVLSGLMVANTFYWRRPALLALGEAGFPTRVNLVLGALKVVGVILLLPRYGYLAAAALLAAFYLLSTAATVWKLYTRLPKAKPAE